MTNWREFRPQQNLLNSKFDGYRLSLEPLAQYIVKFDDPLRVQKDAQLDKDLYSLNGIKGFKSINQLYTNPWKDEHELYFFDQTYSIQRISISSNDSLSHLPQPSSVYQLPKNSLYGSMTFISDSMVLLSDGRSKVFVLNTSQPKWRLLHEEDFDEFVTPPIRLLHAVLHQETIHAIIGCLESGCQLLWATFSLGSSSGECKLIRRRTLLGKRWPDFLALEPNGEGVYIAAEQTYKFIFDSLIQVKSEEEAAKPSVIEKIESPLRYTWSQTQGAVEVEIATASVGEPHQWSVNIESDRLKCSLNGTVLIDAKLFDHVDAKESSYLIASDKTHQLTITLQKTDAVLFWNEVFREGRAIPGEINMVDVPETNNGAPEDDDELKQPYNSQQLEECDQYSNDNDTYLYRFNGDTHSITHQALIYNQILFTKLNPPSLCIRHDVDGLIWEMKGVTSESQAPWSHEGTLNAFGYVQASKQNRKFISTPSDYSYALIADLSTHLYLYKQHSPASNLPGTTLRNRKTGQLVESIAKQYMISLENREEILGLITTSERIYVLIDHQFVVIAI